MNALNHTAERIIEAKTQLRPRTFTVQVEAAKTDGPLQLLSVYVTDTSAVSAEARTVNTLREHGYAIHRVVRVLATVAA